MEAISAPPSAAACGSRMIPKDKLEQRVIQQIKEKVLTDENLEELLNFSSLYLRSRLKAK
jgi:hypothetical protein